jgi:PKD repeat protein
MLVNLKKTFALPEGHSDFTKLNVRVRVSGSNNPTRLYAANGSLITKTGVATLSSTGAVDVWVASSLQVKLELFDTVTKFVYSVYQAIDPASPSGMTEEQSSQLADLYQASLDAGTVVSPVASFSAVPDGFFLDITNMVLQYPTTATLTSMVDWGDGSAPEETADLRTGTASHEYADIGSYDVKVSARSGTVIGAPASSRVPITDEIALGFSAGRYTDTFLIDLSITGNFDVVGSTIDWGDGTGIVTLTDDPLGLLHEYPDDSTYTINVVEVGTGRTGQYELDVANATDYGPSPLGPRADVSSTVGIATDTAFSFYDVSLLQEQITSWLWNFGDSSTSTLQNPSHTYATVGSKTVTLAINGGTPVTVATLNVIAEPAWTATPVMADTFAVDGVMNNRVPTTPMVGVLDEWKSSFANAVTLSGKYTNDSTDNGGPVEITQWSFGDPGAVTPPAQLLNWELSFDWANSTTPPEGPHDTLEAQFWSVVDGTDQIQLGRLTWNPYSEGRWSFTLYPYPVGGGIGAQKAILIDRPAVNVPLTVRVAYEDGKQYLFVGDQVTFAEVADTPRAVNKITMQLGRKDSSNGTDKIDNLVLNALT